MSQGHSSVALMRGFPLAMRCKNEKKIDSGADVPFAHTVIPIYIYMCVCTAIHINHGK